MARGLKFRIKIEQGLYYPGSENKDAELISFAVICVFVFAYAKCWFSHDAAHFQSVTSCVCADWVKILLKDVILGRLPHLPDTKFMQNFSPMMTIYS